MPELQGLDVHTVSFVDRAAVRDPQNKSEPMRFLLWKRDGSAESIDKKGSDTMDDATKAALEKADPAVKEAFEKAEAAAKAAVEKAEADAKAAVEKAEQDGKDAVKKAEEERDKAIAKAKSKKGEGSDANDGDDGDEDDLKKADLPQAVRDRLDKAEKDAAERIEKAEKEAKEASEVAKAERDQRVTKEFVAKAESEMGALPVEAEKFGPVLKSASEKLSKEEYDELDRVLKAASEQVERGALFKEIGGSGGAGSSGTDAFSELQRKAEDIRKADTKLSPEEALAKAMDADPELQRRYLAEQRG